MKYLWFFMIGCVMSAAARAEDAAVTLGWAANRETDLLGYRIYCGTASRQYSRQIDVGLATEYTVRELSGGIHYFFAITALDVWGNESAYSAEVTAIPGDEAAMPWRFTLDSAYPNPLRGNSVTTFRYGIPEAREVTLTVFNGLGQRVKTLYAGLTPAGFHQRTWDGRDDAGQFLAAGVYYLRLHSGKHMLVKPFTFIP